MAPCPGGVHQKATGRKGGSRFVLYFKDLTTWKFGKSVMLTHLLYSRGSSLGGGTFSTEIYIM